MKKFKEEILRIIMNGILLLVAASISLIYREFNINPFALAMLANIGAIILFFIGRSIGKNIDKID